MLTERTRIRRQPRRGAYEPEALFAVFDAAPICTVAFSVDDQPYAIPTIHGRIGDRLYLHGAPASRMLRRMSSGAPVCVTATLVDGLVVGRSAFHHSMNYRSALALGVAHEVEGDDEKLAGLRAIVERLIPHRWDDCRQPNAAELRGTSVLCLPLTEGSVKIRTGPPIDAPADYDLPYWAGVIPWRSAAGPAEPDPQLRAGVELPAYLNRS
jgi:hypothetical protein